MPIDPSIAMGVRPLEVPNQLAQYGQLAQIQNAQNQNALAQFQLASAQRGEEQQSNFYREAQRPGFTLDAATAMRYGAPGMAALKAQQEAQKQELERQKLTGEIKKQASDEIDSSLSVFKKAIPGIRTPQQVERYVREQYRHPVVGKIAGMFMSEDEAVADALTQASTPDGLNTWKLDNIGLTGAQLLDMMKQTTDITDLGGTSSAQTRDWKGAPVGAPVSTPKTPLPADVEAQKARFALAGRPPAQPRPEQPPVAVVDQATGKIVYVSREEALANRMTPATSIEGITPKEIQKREAAYPQVTAAFKGAIAENEQLASDLEKLKIHPGLSGMTGTIYGRTLSMKGSSKEAKALYDKIVARGGFQKLTDMRQSSPTGAALGPVSDSEGKYLRAAFGALDPNQNTDSFQKAIDQAITELRSSNGRLQDAYGMTYEYRGGQSAPAPKPGGSALSPAEQSELDALRIRFKK